MLKKAAILSSLNNLSLSSCTSTTSTTSPRALPNQRARLSQSQYRTYADVRSIPDLSWPSTPSIPTPYEIFHLDQGDPYSKRTFYELVKLYHPDRYGHTSTQSGEISHATKLERYRLVILAHEILSDPIKKREYDRCGAGWVDRHTRWARYNAQDQTRGDNPFGFGAGYDASPFRNATWEDWERWHTKSRGDSAQAYEGNYISPNHFASLIILLAVISGFAQATRAGQYSLRLEEKIKSINEETHNFMQTRADGSSDLGVDGRVKLFLEKRDSKKLGLKDGEEESYGRAFRDQLPPSPKQLPAPAEET